VRQCYSCGGCTGDWDEGQEIFIQVNEQSLCNACERIRDENGDDSWMSVYWLDRYVTIAGKKYHSIERSGNFHYCSECIRPIYGIPLLLWGEGGETMIAFCHECTRRLICGALLIPR